MPDSTLDLRIIRGSTFLRASLQGGINLAMSRNALRDVLAGDAHNSYDVLLDVRRSHVQLTSQEVMTLVEDLKAHAPRFRRRMALLDSQWGKNLSSMQFLQALAEREGFQVRTFVDFENAMDWLWAGQVGT